MLTIYLHCTLWLNASVCRVIQVLLYYPFIQSMVKVEYVMSISPAVQCISVVPCHLNGRYGLLTSLILVCCLLREEVH